MARDDQFNHSIGYNHVKKFNDTFERVNAAAKSPLSKVQVLRTLIEVFEQRPELVQKGVKSAETFSSAGLLNVVTDYENGNYQNLFSQAPTLNLALANAGTFWHARGNGSLILQRLFESDRRTTIVIPTYNDLSSEARHAEAIIGDITSEIENLKKRVASGPSQKNISFVVKRAPPGENIPHFYLGTDKHAFIVHTIYQTEALLYQATENVFSLFSSANQLFGELRDRSQEITSAQY
ncbi:hypothetical protein [Rhizobium leguminosarum]